jgi:tetratricopeptide (TPR) repeat protein
MECCAATLQQMAQCLLSSLIMLSPGRIILLAASLTSAASAGQTIGVLRSQPLPTPQELSNLESRVLQNPEDLVARIELLQIYLDTAPVAPNDDPGRRAVRLQHILYLVEHHPENAASASQSAYVYGVKGPYANAADHAAVRDQWLAAVQGHPRNNAVTLNAAKFQEVEDQDDAEELLRRALDADPANRELAANLGFLYAKEILGSDLAAHAREQLEQSSNPVVLAAAGTALPNLAVKANGARIVDPKIFDLASELSDRARQLAPDDSDIQGPMPLIKYFAAAQEPRAISAPSRIRVGENVQSANLVRKTQPQRPADVQVAGDVRFTAIIGRDGTIQNLELISGHPLLVEAARKAAETWLYRPTLLNGTPVEVVTTITVSFPPN